MDYTAEQIAVIHHAQAGTGCKVIAFAGAGKTTTLVGVAKHTKGRKKLYIAYNTSVAKDGQAAFGLSATSKTGHALAYREEAPWIATKKLGPAWQMRERIPDVTRGILRKIPPSAELKDSVLLQTILETLHKFCYSGDPVVMDWMIPKEVRILVNHRKDAQAILWVIRDATQAYWNFLMRTPDLVAITHDVYLKRWALSNPRLLYDMILFDEAQDANPVMTGVLCQQTHAQVIWVGDPYQQIYQWRGAVDALKSLDLQTFPISQSWRFGPEIAAYAYQILSGVFGASPTLQGLGPSGMVVFDGSIPDQQRAILCRTNRGVLDVALEALTHRIPFAIIGGVDSLVKLLEGMWALYQGRQTSHPELLLFKSWDQLMVIIEEGGESGWKALAEFVQENKEKVLTYVKELRATAVPEAKAQWVISTAHKAKGREWDTVSIWNDFQSIVGRNKEGEVKLNADEARLQYVAVTRPRRCLDLRSATDLVAGISQLESLYQRV